MYSPRMAKSTTKQTCFFWDFLGSGLRNGGSDKENVETRDKIIIAAFEEMYEKGFQAASLSNILKNTGLTKGALYHHFKNKKELGFAVLDEVICSSYLIENWISPLEGSDDPITTIEEIMYEYAQRLTKEGLDRGCPLHNLSQEMSPLDATFRERVVQAYDDWKSVIEVAIQRGIDSGNVKSNTDPKAVSLLIVATLQGCLGMAKATQDIETLESCGTAMMHRLETMRPGT